MNLIVCGLPMCGKTTLGKLLAEKLQWEFIDTDALIEHFDEKKRTCREIYREEGEKTFRDLEEIQIATLKSKEKSIISVGGGSLENPNNVNVLQKMGSIIYLQASIERLWERTQDQGIPAFLSLNNPKEDFYAISKRRILVFESISDHTLDTENLSTLEILERIPWRLIILAQSLKSRHGGNPMVRPLA